VGGEVRLLSRLVGERGRVVSVEAHPRTARCLACAVDANGLTNVTVLQCAVVGRAGQIYLEDNPIAHIRNGLTTDATAGVAVGGRTLGEIVTSLGLDRIDLLKMNIEGAEQAVLEGSVDVLGRVEHLVVSCHDFLAVGPDRTWQRTFNAVTDVLRVAGFTIRTRPDDRRPWIPYYVYASRSARTPAPQCDHRLQRPVRESGAI
jgi:FkbM family methyltransferase